MLFQFCGIIHIRFKVHLYYHAEEKSKQLFMTAHFLATFASLGLVVFTFAFKTLEIKIFRYFYDYYECYLVGVVFLCFRTPL